MADTCIKVSNKWVFKVYGALVHAASIMAGRITRRNKHEIRVSREWIAICARSRGIASSRISENEVVPNRPMLSADRSALYAKPEPMTGAEIVAAGLTGGWRDLGIEDGHDLG